MLMLATTRITVLRGQTTDEWGDPIDNNTVHVSGVLANIAIKTIKATTESSGMPQQVINAVCRVRSNLDITSNDLIIDEKTGESWQVVSTSRLQHPGMKPDLRLNLLRVE